MTAVNIARTDERMTVWTDGLAYHADGTIHSIVKKTRRISDWNAVVATTGLHFAGIALAELLPFTADSFDEFLEAEEENFREVMVAVQRYIDGSRQKRFAAFIAGWSDSLGRGELIVYNDMAGTGRGAISRSNGIVSPQLTQPETQAVACALAARVGPGCKPSFTDIARETMEVQRRHRANPEYASDNHFVGGEITETVIDAKGITERVIHRWNDKIGEKVKPELAFPANVAPLVGMSRQQRRQAEKLAKKGRAA